MTPIEPGSICADHTCEVVHPGMDHGKYVRDYPERSNLELHLTRVKS